jgi:hypothetical protein
VSGKSRSAASVESVTRPIKRDPPGGVVALFSCSAGERAFEDDELHHGVFFKFVIEGLRGAAARPSGEVTLPLLEDFVQRRVTDYVAGKYGVRQQPERVGKTRGTVTIIGGK